MHSYAFSNSAYLYIGIAVRIAFSLGLHLDKYFSPNDLIQKEHARRIWATLQVVDQELAFRVGKPSMAAPPAGIEWQCPLPSEQVVSKISRGIAIEKADTTYRSWIPARIPLPVIWHCPYPLQSCSNHFATLCTLSPGREGRNPPFATSEQCCQLYMNGQLEFRLICLRQLLLLRRCTRGPSHSSTLATGLL